MFKIRTAGVYPILKRRVVYTYRLCELHKGGKLIRHSFVVHPAELSVFIMLEFFVYIGLDVKEFYQCFAELGFIFGRSSHSHISKKASSRLLNRQRTVGKKMRIFIFATCIILICKAAIIIFAKDSYSLSIHGVVLNQNAERGVAAGNG